MNATTPEVTRLFHSRWFSWWQPLLNHLPSAVHCNADAKDNSTVMMSWWFWKCCYVL